jgi:hypothetical protein
MNLTFMLTVSSQRFKISAGPYVGAGLLGNFARKNRFDAGYSGTIGYESAQNAWTSVGMAVGLTDAENNKEGTRYFSFKFTIGIDF